MPRPTLFIVDSDKAATELLIAAFNNDFVITQFTSAENALPIIVQESPDVVIFEYLLPGMTGIEFFEKIQGKESLLIMISSLDDGSMVLQFIQKGVRNYIMKDETLADSVKEVLNDEL